MKQNETAALRCTGNAARESAPTPRRVERQDPHRKDTARRHPPLSSETLLEIPRTERSRLRVELVTWDDDHPPVVRFVVLMLGRNGIWIPAPHRASLRMDELTRVAEVLVELGE